MATVISFANTTMVIWWWCFLLLGNAGFTARVRGQASTEDFISIDCGITEGYNYTDDVTKIYYTSDAEFIDKGTNYKISEGYMKNSFPTQFSTLRSFPNDARNCYTIESFKPGVKYLIRASFLYGNYDGKKSVPIEFELHLGVNLWQTIRINDASRYYIAEVITVPSSKYIWVCLVNTGLGTPFISSLELRPMKDSIYPAANDTQPLVLFNRKDIGSETNRVVRYPDDPYDRIWFPYNYAAWTPVTTDQPIANGPNDLFDTPSAVLRTAATPTTGEKIEYSWTPATTGDQYYLFLHFAELQSSSPPKLRAFGLFLNDQLLSKTPFEPLYLTAGHIYSSAALARQTQYTFALQATKVSALPPILNGLEIYSAMALHELATHADDVDAIVAIKTKYQLKKNWTGDPCAPSKYVWDGLVCNYGSPNPPRITTLNLSSCGLTGEISSSLANLTAITNLDLSNNSLTGEIPDFLADMSSLKLLNLAGNQLSGSIPLALLSRSKSGSLTLSTTGNPSLCIDGGSCERRKKKKIALIIVICLIVVMVVLGGIVIYLWRSRSRRHQGQRNEDYPGRPDNTLQPESRQFTYMQLQKMTNNFERDIGSGGFGNVYLGNLNGTQVAVKLRSDSSGQGTKQFLAEVKLLTRVHHRNLVTFVGYCRDENYLALVYEYLAEGSLQQHLSGITGNARSLSWCERLQIAFEAAQGLEYLHKKCRPAIIHRDVKTSNILLSQNLEAKIADFGMSKAFYSDNQTHISTMNVAGTEGYLDPEYQKTGKLNEKSDVYSFGVVLLELITGQPALSASAVNSQSNVSIFEWVNQRMENEVIASIVDTKLQGEYVVNSVQKVLKLAKQCTEEDPKKRVIMTDVVTQLKECLEAARGRAPNANPEVPGTS